MSFANVHAVMCKCTCCHYLHRQLSHSHKPTDLQQLFNCHLCRFGTLALRVRTARFFQAVFAMAVAVLGWAVYQLDYARQFR